MILQVGVNPWIISLKVGSGSTYKWGEITPINGRKSMGLPGVISPL